MCFCLTQIIKTLVRSWQSFGIPGKSFKPLLLTTHVYVFMVGKGTKMQEKGKTMQPLHRYLPGALDACTGLHRNKTVNSKAQKRKVLGDLAFTAGMFAADRSRARGNLCLHLCAY